MAGRITHQRCWIYLEITMEAVIELCASRTLSSPSSVVCAILNPAASRAFDCWSRFTPVSCLHTSYDWLTDPVAVKKTFTIESQRDQSCCWMVSVRWSFVMILIFANNYNCNIIRMRSLNFPGYLCCSRVLLIFPTALGLDGWACWFWSGRVVVTLPSVAAPSDVIVDCNLWTILFLAFHISI